MTHRFRSSSEPYTYRYKASEVDQLDQFWHDPYYSATLAQTYFAAATNCTKDPNLAAKATYMAARCEAHALQARRTVEAAKTGSYVADDDQEFAKKMRQIADYEYDTYFKTYQTNLSANPVCPANANPLHPVSRFYVGRVITLSTT